MKPDYEQLLLLVALAEYLVFICSGTSFSFLHKIPYFNFGIDPSYWILFFLRIPQFIVNHLLIGILLDITIVGFFILLILDRKRQFAAYLLFSLLFIFYVTLTAYLGHRNYQAGFVFVLIPFLFSRQTNRQPAFEALRYFLLFYYFSAGFIKLIDLPGLDASHFSKFLQLQLAPYYFEGSTGWRTTVNIFLITHEKISFGLYIFSMIIELSAFAGFFTKRFDRFIGLMILVFHLTSWFIMDIAPIGQLAFVLILFYRAENQSSNK